MFIKNKHSPFYVIIAIDSQKTAYHFLIYGNGLTMISLK